VILFFPGAGDGCLQFVGGESGEVFHRIGFHLFTVDIQFSAFQCEMKNVGITVSFFVLYAPGSLLPGGGEGFGRFLRRRLLAL
jgi:hypothetical protein